MNYDDYLLKVLRDRCPFCDIEKEHIVEKGKHFTVLLARAPYTYDHIMIVPNRHLVRMSEINSDERGSFVPLVKKWTKKLEKIHNEVTILLRDGVAKGVAGKSINHLHFHLIPDIPIYASTSGRSREVYSDYQLIKETAVFKVKFRGK